MREVSKIINIIIYSFVMIGLLIMIAAQFYTKDNRSLPISLGYVYSGSMEPVIKTNDGYVMIKAKEYHLHDIITFEPKVLREKYVTHRIVEVMPDQTFRTHGDHNQSTDQEGGEPLVKKDQILGKVFTINGAPVIIPYLGIISAKFNIYIFISFILGIYLIGYTLKTFFPQHKTSKRKRKRKKMMVISTFLDPVFIAFSIILFVNVLFIGFVLKSNTPDQFTFIVVSTKGLSSPTPGEQFAQSQSLKNNMFFTFITFLEPIHKDITVTPHMLMLPPYQHDNYTLSIIAPQKVGLYTEMVDRFVYPGFLPSQWINLLYKKNRLLPYIIIFSPGIILNIGLYVWWLKRCQLGRRKIWEWVFPLRKFL